MPYNVHKKPVSMNDALDAWAPIAVTTLTDTAKIYQGFVTYKQLAETVQEQSGIRHKGLMMNWIGSVLGRVIDHCNQEEIPQLSALCVREDGTVGEGYRYALLASGGPADAGLDQLDDHAAEERLKCYRYFGAQLPAGGGVPTLTPKAKAAKDYKKNIAKMDAPPKLCPRCNTVLPLTGKCDECS